MASTIKPRAPVSEKRISKNDIQHVQSLSPDEADMIKVGKTQQTKRSFGLISMLGFTTIMLCSWESAFPFFYTTFLNGGGVTIIYGFIFAWVGSLATCASIAELTSMYPTSGGQYHWAALLAPEKYKKFLSWFTGWISVLGWQAATATGIYLSGALIQGLVVLNYPSYNPQRWQGTLLFYAVIVFDLIVNTVGIKIMPALEAFILVAHIAGFLLIVIPLVHYAPHGSAKFVFTEFINQSGYPDGVSWLIGMTLSAVLFVGYDGSAHMVEEVKNASINVPRSMFFTIFINGFLGLGAFIALLFCIGDIDSALDTPTGWPFIQIFYNATKSKAGATAMTSLIVALFMVATVGYVASSSRQLWAFARDRALPFSSYLARINPRLQIPLYTIFLTGFLDALICLINIGSTVAFNAMISMVVAGLFTSYLITIGLMIRKRLLREHIPFGPWTMGKWGLPVNVFAFTYTLIAIVFSFFPPATPITPVSMNWSIAVYVGVIAVGLIYYPLSVRKHYNGPVIDRRLIPQ